MKKVVTIVLGTLLLLVSGFFLIAEWWVERIFNEVMNKKPDRVYNVTYADLDLHTFLKGVTLESAQIVPINASDSGTVLNGTVSHIELSGIQWRHFFFSKKANVREMVFINPDFQISLSPNKEDEEKHRSSSNGLQNLFGDILSRGEIKNFRLVNGSAEARRDSVLMAKVTNLSIRAEEIVTDSIQARSLIPFKVGSFTASVDSSILRLNEYTILRSGYFGYEGNQSQLELNNIAMSFTDDRMQVSQRLGMQVDLIEAKVKSLKIIGLDATSNVSDLDIRAQSMLIDAFEMTDFRDKNQQRPPDSEKPMFSGMVKNIPISLNVDSIHISDSHIYYAELGEGKEAAGTLHFADINGTISTFTTIPEFQDSLQSFAINITAKLNQRATMAMTLEVPYHQESFKMHTSIGGFKLAALNTTLRDLAGVEVTSGDVHKIDIKMDAGGTGSSNILVMDYDSLGLAVVTDYHKDYKIKPLISTIANGAIRKANLPGEKHYQIAEYQSYRNIYRGPFNFMWGTVKEGMMLLVPTGAAGILLGDIEKKSRKKQKKEIEKHKSNS